MPATSLDVRLGSLIDSADHADSPRDESTSDFNSPEIVDTQKSSYRNRKQPEPVTYDIGERKQPNRASKAQVHYTTKFTLLVQ